MDKAGLRYVIDCAPVAASTLSTAGWEKIVLNLISNAFKYTSKASRGFGVRFPAV
jgi:hypothetical protein